MIFDNFNLSSGATAGLLTAAVGGMPAWLGAGGPDVAGVEVSVLVSEAHQYTATLSKLALENGAQISDHVIINPESVTVVVNMSNAAGGSDAARSALEAFKDLLEQATPVELATEHYYYDNMVITSVTPDHRAPYKGSLSITLKLEKARFVELQTAGRDPAALPPNATARTPTTRTRPDHPDVTNPNSAFALAPRHTRRLVATRRWSPDTPNVTRPRPDRPALDLSDSHPQSPDTAPRLRPRTRRNPPPPRRTKSRPSPPEDTPRTPRPTGRHCRKAPP